MTGTGFDAAKLGQYTNLGTVTANWTNAGTPSSGSVTASDLSHYLGLLTLDDEESKVEVCHRSSAGTFSLISVGSSAEAAHLAHGHGKPGGPVPGQPGKIFEPTCRVQ